jgi:hypothetical protein
VKILGKQRAHLFRHCRRIEPCYELVDAKRRSPGITFSQHLMGLGYIEPTGAQEAYQRAIVVFRP